MAVVHGVRAAARPPAGARRQRADVMFTGTGKLPVKFDYWLGG